MQRPIPRAVIFDCDGTLVDSELIHAKALHGALAGLGVTLSVEQIRCESTGFANMEFLNRVASERDLTLPADIEARADDIAFQLIASEVRLMQGADRVTRALAADGVGLAVASNSSRRLVRHMLSTVGLSPFFGERVVTREEVVAPKPAPDIYQLAGRLLSARSEEIIAVEDSPVGVTAAHRAGIAVIGFCPPSGMFRREELIRAGAFEVIDELADLLRRLP